jgi:hypothetical protein
LQAFRREKVFVGSHNEADVRRGFAAQPREVDYLVWSD